MVGGNEDVIDLVEGGGEACEFLGVVVPVDLQVQIAAVDPAEGIVAVHAEGQAVVVVRFVGYGRAINEERARINFDAEIVLRATRDGEWLIKLERIRLSARILLCGEIYLQ